MPAVSLIKFTQGPNTDGAGKAVLGTLASVDGPVTITNGDNAFVNSWEILLLDAPARSTTYPLGSQPQVLASAVSATPSASFSPDVPGTYRILQDVLDGDGLRNRDIRCFGVPDERGFVEPPYQKNPNPLPVTLPGIITPISDPQIKPDEQNYGTNSRGWAGDGSSGQLSTFYRNVRDARITTMTTTPYSPAGVDPEYIVVNTTTIGGASVVNLPSTTRVGQLWVVQDGQNSAFDNPITVNLPGGTTLTDGVSTSKAIFASGGLLVLRRISATRWVIVASTSREEYIQLSGRDSTNNTGGFDVAGGIPLDPSRYGLGARFIFEAVMETTNAANLHRVQLFNVTTASVVGTPLTTTSLGPVPRSEVFESPSDLPASEQIYEVQHQMGAGAGPDFVTLGSSRLRCVYASSG